jgi:hypothetical protein
MKNQVLKYAYQPIYPMLTTLETFRNYSHTKYLNDIKQLVPKKLILLLTIQFIQIIVQKS